MMHSPVVSALGGVTVSYLVDKAEARLAIGRHGSRRRAGRDRYRNHSTCG